MLDARRLRLLRELAARGTVTAVAEALSYTPSAVSQQLAALERDAGVPLLERVGRGVRLTDAGRLLVTHAEVVITRLEEAEADLAAAAGRVWGRLRVASFQTAAQALVLPALGALEQLHPELECALIQAEAEHSLPALRLGDLDLVVAEEYHHAPRPRDPALEYRELCRDALLVSVPASHRLASQPAIALAELAAEEWTGATPGSNFNDMIERTCRSEGGFEPRLRHHVDDIRLMIGLVRHGSVALVPSLGRPQDQEGVVAREPAEGPIDRIILTVVRRGTGERPSLKALHEALAEQAARLGLP